MIWHFAFLPYLVAIGQLASAFAPHGSVLILFKRYSTDEPVSFFAPMSQILFWMSVAGLVAFCMGFRWMRFWRLIQDTPFSKMASASMGLVEVSGRATGPRTIKAALTGADCLYYRAVAWQRGVSGGRSDWKQSADESVCVPFFVEDSTGKLFVQPEGAQMEVQQTLKKDFDARFYRGGDSWPELIRDFVARNGLDTGRDLRVEEHCIKPGETLFVIGELGESRGMLSWDPRRHFGKSRMVQIQLNGPAMLTSKTSWKIGAQPKGGGEWTTTRIESTKHLAPSPEIASALEQAATSGKSTVLINQFLLKKKDVPPFSSGATTAQAALPEDMLQEIERATGGKITGEQIKQAMEKAVEAQGSDKQQEQAEEWPKVAIRDGGRREPFIISWKSQREVIGDMKRKAMVFVWGGPAVAVIALYLLLLLLGKIPVGG